MCGIAGFLHTSPDAAAGSVLERMLEVLTHRGPDEQGVHVASWDGSSPGQIALGHRRLKIIDLSDRAHQPMSNDDGSIWLTYNGEIYNFRELRQELEGRGYRFRSTSDTEVLLRLYEADGEACVSRLNGMFAFAVWDARRRTLLLARDRFGIKPLYYWCSLEMCVFASELKALLRHPAIPRELDLQALDAYLTFLCVPAPQTILVNVRKLEPGYLLRMDAQGPALVRYASPAQRSGKLFRRMADACEAVRTVLRRSIERQLVADVPIGVFLSGGIDSSLLSAETVASRYRPLKTFSVGFRDSAYDERAFAREIAARLGTEHHEWVWELQDIKTLRRVVWHLDEPFGDASALANFSLAELAAREVKVALSGAGGDELFGGYQQYQAARWMLFYDQLLPQRWRKAVARHCQRLRELDQTEGWTRRLYRMLLAGDLSPIARHVHYMTQLSFTRWEKPQLYQPDVLKSTAMGNARAYPTAWAEEAAGDLIDRLLSMDTFTYLTNDILTLTDRMSMAHSLEVRVPFLDQDVVDVAARIPSKWKVGLTSTKRVLRLAYSRFLPAQVLRREKHGFGIPLRQVLAGKNMEWAELLLDTNLGVRQALFDTTYVRRLVEEHLAGRRDHSTRLWLLLVFELWCQEVFEDAAVTVPV